jgi:very-short-patch-repair endonuclease
MPRVRLPLADQIKLAGLPAPREEYEFHNSRKWRFDFAWPSARLAVEVDGGTWLPGGGRHNRARGFQADLRKLNEAALCGWTVIRADSDMVRTGEALRLIDRALRIKQSGLYELPPSPEEP